ncbi:MAG: PAS-domain containing protein [Rickettsiales bacterium]
MSIDKLNAFMFFVILQIIFLVACCGWVIFIIIDKFYQKNINFDLSEVDYKLFYYKDFSSNREYISKDLREILSIHNKKKSFGDLVSYFDEQSQKLLNSLYSRLNKSADSRGTVVVRDVDLAIKVKLKLSTEQNINHFSCQYLVLRDKKQFGKSFFIFFADISDDMLEVENLQHRNTDLENLYSHTSFISEKLEIPLWVRTKEGKFIYENHFFSDKIIPNMDVDYFKSETPLNNTKNLYLGNHRKTYKFHERKMEDPDLFYGVGSDVTEKKQHQTILRKYSLSLSKLLEASSNAVAIYGPDRKVQFYNKSFVELWPLDEKFLKTEPLYDDVIEYLRERKLFPDNLDYRQTKKERIKFFNDLLSTHNEFLFLPDGRTIRMVIVQHAFGGLIFVYEDMTDRYELESSCKTLNAVQNKTINNINDGVAVFAENGKVVITNPKFLKVWEFETFPNDTHYNKFFEKIEGLLRKETQKKFFNQFLDCFNNRVSHSFTVRTTNNKTLSVMVTPLPDGATLISINDITDSNLLERNLREKNKLLEHMDRLKTEFLNNISYELRSPLTSIMGFSEILKNQYHGKLNQKQIDCLYNIEKSSDSLLIIINEILDLASLEAGRVQLHQSEVVLNELISEIFVEKEFEIKSNDEYKIYVDKKYMISALKKIKYFILNNIREKSSIPVSVNKSNGVCELVFGKIKSDNPHFINLLQTNNGKEYLQIDSPFTSHLSIAKTILDLHKGSISAPSSSKIIIKIPGVN